MTIKEAIEWIEKYRSDWEHECKSHHPMKEALQMAIAALEKQEQYAKAEAEGRLIVLPCKVEKEKMEQILQLCSNNS